MIINNKNILIFPEYHLTDFPPQIKMSQDEAHYTLMTYKDFGFDIFAAGYVEKDGGNLYSSCLIIDGDNIFNIRKRYPYNEEIKIITPWRGNNHPIELSIGRSYFILCNDMNSELKEQSNMNRDEDIENLFLISAMFNNFNENVKAGIDYCNRFNIKRFITADRFNGVKQQVLKNLA
jgi:predicted amidohydrolase